MLYDSFMLALVIVIVNALVTKWQLHRNEIKRKNTQYLINRITLQ